MPRSLSLHTVRVSAAPGSIAPFLMMRTEPVFCSTTTRPSGTATNAVGVATPAVTTESVKPAATVPSGRGVGELGSVRGSCRDDAQREQGNNEQSTHEQPPRSATRLRWGTT